MCHILLISLSICLFFVSDARASVFEFNPDGSITKYEASDYLSQKRHHKHQPTPASHVVNQKTAYDDFIKNAARKFNVDAALIHAIIFVESAYKYRAVSPKGAEGLMQLMPKTALQYGIKDTFDPEQNIQGGTQHFRTLLDKYKGDIPLALAAYNAGEQAVAKYKGVPPYQETENYIDKVVSFYKKN